VPPVHAGGRSAGADAGGGREAAGRPATDTGQDSERTAPAPAPAGDADPESLVVGGLGRTKVKKPRWKEGDQGRGHRWSRVTPLCPHCRLRQTGGSTETIV
jgi:hypothetical protein